MVPDESRAGSFDHAAAWLGGVVLAGLAVVTAGLCGTVALLVRNHPDPQTAPVGSGSLGATQWAGLAVLLFAALGFALSHAASQQPARLPARVQWMVHHADAILGRLPVIGPLRTKLPNTEREEISRFVAVVGPFACSVIAALGTWLATDLGLRALFLGGAFAGAAAAGAAILVEPHDTSIQSAGMFVALLAGSFSAFGWSSTAGIVLGFGSLWIIIIADITDAVVQRATAWVTFLVVGVAVAAMAVLSELDNTLASLTLSGRQPRSFGDLAPLLQPQHAADRVQQVAGTWLEFRRSVDPYTAVSPPSDYLIRSIYAFIDSVGFAAAYSLLLIALTNALMERLGGADGRRDLQHERLRSILTVTKFSVPVLFLLDVAENVSGAAAVLPHSAVQSVNGADVDGIGGLATLLALLHWVAAVTKWIAVVGAIVAVAATAITLAVERRRDAGERTPLSFAIWLVRGHLVLVAVLALGLRNRQTFDAIRRLARGDELAGTEVLALAVTVIGCACAIRYLAELAGREAVRVDPDTAPADSPTPPRAAPGRSRISDLLELTDANDRRANSRLWHGALATALALVMAFFLGAPGGLIPVVIWIVLEILSLPLRPRRPDNQPIGAAHRRAVWRRRVAVAFGIVAAIVGVAWVFHLLGDASWVRWLLIVLGVGVALQALSRLVPLAVLVSSWLGLKPCVRAGFGARPLFGRLVPAIGYTIDRTWDWLIHSILRRLLYPLIWVLQFVQRGAADKLSDMLGREPAGPTAAGAAPADRSDESDAAEPTDRDRRAAATTAHTIGIARVLGGLVPILIGAAIIRSALGLALYDAGNRGGTWLILLGVGFVAVGPVIHSLPTVSPRAWGRGAGMAAVRLAIAGIFVLYLLAWQTVEVPDVIAVTRRFGAVGVLCVALALFALVATIVSYLVAATDALPSLQLLKIQRVPFYGFAIAWIVIASTIDRGGYHNIDTQAVASGAEGTRVSAQEAFTAWAADCVADDSGRQAVPMVFVAASGGGIRAAYWTATALEEFDRQVDQTWGAAGPCTQPIFAASGASGGSVGISSYAVSSLASTAGGDGVRDRLDDDYLAPTVAWFLLADLVRPFLLWDIDGDATVDRARVLELAWEDSWQDLPLDPANEPRCELADQPETVSLTSGLRETWCLGAPLLLLNGSEVNSACRFNTSVLDNRTLVRADGQSEEQPPTPTNCLRPPTVLAARDSSNGPMGATIDLQDYLCDDRDIAMSTAALLSARFPFVSPSARVEPCAVTEGTAHDTVESPAAAVATEPSFVVDGGYIDNSGASPLVELWAEVSAYVDTHNADPDNVCIVPVFLQLDNGYDFDTGSRPKRPNELMVPLSTALGARGSREAEAKQVAANIFTTPDFSGNQRAISATGARIVRWTRIVPEAHPGVQAPLGWVLSDAATADLDAQLAAEADDGFKNVDQWLADGLQCTQTS